MKDRAGSADSENRKKCAKLEKGDAREAGAARSGLRESSCERRFNALIKDLKDDPKVLRMKQYIQHGQVSTYDHAMDVARMSYTLARGLRLKVREGELVRGALLHDYFLYDWHDGGHSLHGLTHPALAARNARGDFHLTEREADVIESHMWPLTLRHRPHSREAALVCAADKICSLKETILGRSQILFSVTSPPGEVNEITKSAPGTVSRSTFLRNGRRKGRPV